MATINIGNLTFTHKGDYASGTAYVKNDVVYYSTNGNAYIAKQATTGNAPTNATYWNQFAQGSGGIWNAGLSLGSAGQAVKVNAAGNALEFGTISSDFVKLGETGAVSNVSDVNLNGFFSSDYKIYKVFGYGIYGASAGNGFSWKANTGSGYNTQSTSDYIYANDGFYRSSGGQNNNSNHAWNDNNGCRLGWSGGGSDHENAVEITFYEPQSTTEFKKATFVKTGWDGSATLMSMTGGGEWRSKTAMTGIHIYCYSGNMWANNFIIYGIKS